MRAVSLASGIGGAELAAAGLPIEWLACAEVDPFACRVLSHRQPGVPNVGDLRSLHGIVEPGDLDLVVGGTPCQSFSVAGRRQGLDDPRGTLVFDHFRIAAKAGARWILWENVPGVLHHDEGRTFEAIVDALEELGYGWAYRTLDARYFGVPQRRRRVFLVGRLGDPDGRGPSEVLSLSESLPRDPRPGGPPGAEASYCLTRGLAAGGAHDARGLVTVFDQAQITSPENRSIDFSLAPSLARRSRPVSIHLTQDPITAEEEEAPALARRSEIGVTDTLLRHSRNGTDGSGIVDVPVVRRLTPREWERLQGFPDDWTLVPGASDTARREALGNAFAVPVVRWILRRLVTVDGG